MIFTRRNFLQSTAAGTMAAATINSLGSFAKAEDAKAPLVWAILYHLGSNMWGDCPTAYTPKSDTLLCEDKIWADLTDKSAAAGMNMVVVDLGEGIQYKSHPELAIQGSWTIDKLRADLDRLRKLGLEPIPKLNFSACHDVWLGEYERMLSTLKYYEVCSDLIQEVCEIFDHPRFFHLGYDEETYGHQQTYSYAVVRQGELWWHDFLFFVKTVEKQNVRPWIWSDYYWHHAEEFLARMPKSVLQSNWYYGASFDPEKINYVKTYLDLDKAGFDQIPTGSNWSCDTNFKGTVDFCRQNLSANHLYGFLQTPWKFTQAKDLEYHLRSIDQVKEAKQLYTSSK